MVLLRETGLRIAEACAIMSEEARTWQVPPWWCRRNACVRHASFVIVNGKGSKERRVLLTRRAVVSSQVLLAQTSNGHLVGWTDRGVRYLFERVGSRAGVQCSPHRFRHQAVFDLLEASVPVEVVADMMGHSTVDITRIYYLTSKRRQVAAARKRSRRRHSSRV
jgi:integrase